MTMLNCLTSHFPQPSDEKLAKFVYSTTPKQLNKHLKHIQDQKRAQIESMYHDREVSRAWQP